MSQSAASPSKIYEFSPSGVQSVFASGINGGAFGLAFDTSGNLFVAAGNQGSILKFAPDGPSSRFYHASAFAPTYLAFAPVPEPSSLVLFVVGAVVLLGWIKSRFLSGPAMRSWPGATAGRAGSVGA